MVAASAGGGGMQGMLCEYALEENKKEDFDGSDNLPSII